MFARRARERRARNPLSQEACRRGDPSRACWRRACARGERRNDPRRRARVETSGGRCFHAATPEHLARRAAPLAPARRPHRAIFRQSSPPPRPNQESAATVARPLAASPPPVGFHPSFCFWPLVGFLQSFFWPPVVFIRVLLAPARRLSSGSFWPRPSFFLAWENDGKRQLLIVAAIATSPRGRRRGPTRRPSSSAARPVQAGESGLGRGGDNLQRVCVRVCACVCVPDIAVAAILVRGSV